MLTYSCMCSSIFFNQRTRELGAHIHTQKQPLSKCFCLCQRSFCVVNTYSLCLCVFYFCAVDSLLEATTSTHFFDFLQILFSWGNCDMFFLFKSFKILWVFNKRPGRSVDTSRSPFCLYVYRIVQCAIVLEHQRTWSIF